LASLNVIVGTMLDFLTKTEFPAAGYANDWVSGAIGIFGALLGSIATVVWTEYFNRRTRARNDRQSRHTAAIAVYRKLIKIYSRALEVHKHFEEFNLVYDPNTGSKCFFLIEVVIDIESVYFSDAEHIGVSNSGGKSLKNTNALKLLNKIQELEDGYNSLKNSVLLYGRDRQAFLSSLQPHKVTGVVGFVSDTDPAIQLKASTLDVLIDQTFPMARDIAQAAFDAIENLVHLELQPLGKQFNVSVQNVEGITINLRSADAPVIKKWHQFLSF
jgi:hypothetical protein